MSQKKIVVYFVISTILLLAPLPLLNTFFLYSNGTLNPKNFNKKQLFTTDNIESIRNYIFYKIPKISLNKEQVIIGKDDYLFLGNRYGKIIDKTQGLYPYTQKQIDIWTTKLKEVQDWYEVRSIKFIIVIAPNKHSIYYDKLPENTPYKMKGTITDDIVRYSNKKNINILDLRPILINNKKDKTLYMKTDTHWNNIGASIAYIANI